MPVRSYEPTGLHSTPSIAILDIRVGEEVEEV